LITAIPDEITIQRYFSVNNDKGAGRFVQGEQSIDTVFALELVEFGDASLDFGAIIQADKCQKRDVGTHWGDECRRAGSGSDCQMR